MPRPSSSAAAGLLDGPRAVGVLLCAAVCVRALAYMHPHSGQGRPPMFGDYEAQRHWMELTTAQPLRQWYSYDLQYWGLDYPPLTAYHSYVLGRVGHAVVPEAFAFVESRGHEGYAGKVFMRTSVLVSDLLLFLPASYYAVASVTPRGPHEGRHRFASLALLWLNPGLVLIDYGHFQYNGVCLGLALLGVAFVARGRYLLASVAYTSSFLFKQIALYYAPAFFASILYLCLVDTPAGPAGAFPFAAGRMRLPRLSVRGVVNVLVTGCVVAATAALIFLPWIAAADWAGVGQVVHRMFPFARGLYEDKVANVWCTLSLVWKADRSLGPRMLQVAAGATVATLLPACAACVLRRSHGAGPVVAAMTASAASFYLFSFQVHEKSVLFPAVMACLLPAAAPSGAAAEKVLRAVLLATFAALFSMYPLVVKDGLHVLYVALALCTAAACELACVPETAWRRGWHALLAAVCCVHAVHACVAPPARYPDLMTMMITSFRYVERLGCIFFLLGSRRTQHNSCAIFVCLSSVLGFCQIRNVFDRVEKKSA